MLRSLTNYLKFFFAKVAAAWHGVIEQQREIITEAQINDDKLAVKQDRVNPENYVSFEAFGVKMCMRKAEMAQWVLLPRHEKKRLAMQVKTKIKKGYLVYKEYNGVTMTVDPKQVLNPNNL